MSEDDTQNPSKHPILKHLTLPALFVGLCKIAIFNDGLHAVLYFPEDLRDNIVRVEKIGNQLAFYIEPLQERSVKVIRLVTDSLPKPGPSPYQEQDYPNKDIIAMGVTGLSVLPPITVSGNIHAGAGGVTGRLA